MKPVQQIFLFSFLWLILCGCPSDKKVRNDMKDFRDNHYDFKDLSKKSFHGIYFDCPKVLEKSYLKSFMYKKDGMALKNDQLGIFLSVEKFDDSEAEEFLFYYGDTILKRYAVHEKYMDQRRNSLKYYENSIKTFLPEGTTLPGSFEVIYGRQDDYAEDLMYITATVEKGNNWYVFQFICGQQLAAYMFDDFEAILKSVR